MSLKPVRSLSNSFRFTLLAADYSQIEFRILAHMAQDRHLLDFFTSGNDIHSQIASRWLAKPIEQVTKQERDYSKRIVYGILYGMGAPALGGMLKISVGQAEKFISTFLGKVS
jgi:DNA polymerase-1